MVAGDRWCGATRWVERRAQLKIPELDLCARPQDIRAIHPRDLDVSGCGVPQEPENARYVDLYKVYSYANVLGAAGSGTDILLDEKKQVDCNADFLLHKITAIDVNGNYATGYFARFQWFNGRYSSQALQDIQTFFGVCYTQDEGRNTQAIRYPAGSYIGIGLQNLGNASINVMLFFEGVSRFYLCKGARLPWVA